jgi:hypothetical protein
MGSNIVTISERTNNFGAIIFGRANIDLPGEQSPAEP